MNPYEELLGISDADSHPDYFRLLGVSKDETDKKVIKDATKRQITRLKSFKKGQHAEACVKIFERIKKAHKVLANPILRAKYLHQISAKNELAESGESPTTVKSQEAIPVVDFTLTGDTVSPIAASAIAQDSPTIHFVPNTRLGDGDAEQIEPQPKWSFQNAFPARTLIIAGISFGCLLFLGLAGWGLIHVIGSMTSRPGTADLERAFEPSDDNPLANKVIAEAALELGINSFKEKKYDQAKSPLEEALKFAPSQETYLSALDYLIPIYEVDKDIEKLVTAHQYILDRTVGTESINVAANQLLSSLRMTGVNKGNSNSRQISLRSRSDRIRASSRTPYPNHYDIPQGALNETIMIFEERLVSFPNHEPSLNVLYLIYSTRLLRNPAKRDNLLVRICKIRESRGETLGLQTEKDLIPALTFAGDHEQAALRSQKLADRFSNKTGLPFRLDEAESWGRLEDADKVHAALAKAVPWVKQSKPSDYVSYMTRIGDIYTDLEENAQAYDAYKLALDSGLRSSSIRSNQVKELQEKIKVAMAQAEIVPISKSQNASTSDSPNSLPPAKSALTTTTDLNKIFSSNMSDSQKFSQMIEIADNWIEGGEPNKSKAILSSAEEVLQRLSTNYDTRKNCELLAGTFEKLGNDRKAIQYLLQALRSSFQIGDVERLQKKVHGLSGKGGLLSIADEDKPLLDPTYKFRVSAAHQEKSSIRTLRDRKPGFLISAATNWFLAGELTEAIRCAMDAEVALDNARVRSLERTRLLLSLSNLYIENERPELAVALYLNWMKKSQDADAVNYLARIKTICSETGTPVPVLDAETEAKLDPLNRYRIAAEKAEATVYKTSVPRISRGRQYSAAENWVLAKETDKAIIALKKYGEMLLRDKEEFGEHFDNPCRGLAKFYIKLGKKELAIEFFENAIEAVQTEATKKRLQQQIDLIKQNKFRAAPSTGR